MTGTCLGRGDGTVLFPWGSPVREWWRPISKVLEHNTSCKSLPVVGARLSPFCLPGDDVDPTSPTVPDVPLKIEKDAFPVFWVACTRLRPSAWRQIHFMSSCRLGPYLRTTPSVGPRRDVLHGDPVRRRLKNVSLERWRFGVPKTVWLRHRGRSGRKRREWG